MVLDDDELIDDDDTEKSLKKGKELFKDGYVHDVGNAEDRHCYHLQAHVHHSMKGDLLLKVRPHRSPVCGTKGKNGIKTHRHFTRHSIVP